MATKPRGYTQQPGNVLDYDGLMARALAMPDPQPVEAGKTGALRGVADVGLSLGQGVIGGAKMLTDLAGADNWVSDNLGRSNAMMQDLYSPGRKAEMQQRQAKIAAADATDSTWDQVTSRLGGIAEAPVQAMAQAAGSMLPIVAANVATGGMASVPGAVGMAARYGIPAALGVGMGVGSVKGQNYEAVLNEAMKRGIPEEEAKALAVKASEYSGQNAPQQALGGAFGMLDSLTGAERLLGNMARKGATQNAVESVDGLMKRTVKGAAEEAWPEGLQGGQGQFAQNQALNNSGFATEPWAGVVGQGINDATIGAMIGAPVGAISGGQPTAKADPFAAPPPAGPMQRAAATIAPVAPVAPVAPPADVGGSVGQGSAGTEVDAIASQLDEAPPIEQPKVIDGDNPLITHINDASERDRAAYEQAMGEDKKTAEALDTEKQAISDPKGKYQESQMSDEDKRAVLFSNQAVADGGQQWSGTQDGDILNGMASPFKTKMAAVRRANMEGKDWTIAPVFDGWVARRKDAFNVSDANGVQSVPSTSGGRDGDNAGAGVVDGAADGVGSGSDAGRSSVDPVVQPGELPGGTVAGAVSNSVEKVTGDKIDKEWHAFAPESGTLGIPRAEMPQIKSEHRGAMVNFLNARDIAHAPDELPASSLKPTQTEFSPAKVDKALGFEGNDRSILVSSDNHVLDGHHQWMAKLNAGESVKVIRLDAPIKQLLEVVKEFPSAELANGSTKTQPNVQNTETAAPATKAEAAPDQAPTDGTSQPTTVAGIPATGVPESVQAAGVEEVSQPAQPGTPGEGAGVSQPTQGAKPGKAGPASLGSAKADMDHLFGMDEKRKAGIERIAKGKAWFATLPKANEFLTKSGLKETHEAVKGEKRWDIREKQVVNQPVTTQPPAKVETLVAPAESRVDQAMREGLHMATGRADFAAGKPRTLPSYYLKPGDKNSKDWYRGWDAANAAAPVETASNQSPAPVDTAQAAINNVAPEVEKPLTFDLTPEQRAQADKELADHRAKLGTLVVKDGKVYEVRQSTSLSSMQPLSTFDAYVGDVGSGAANGAIAKAKADGKKIEGLEAEPEAKPLTPNQRIAAKKQAKAAPETQAERANAAIKDVAVKSNTVFTEDAAAAARARLKAKLSRLNSGIDPEMLMDGIILSGYHIEKGARTFAAYARAMLDDLGDGVKPYLKSWYMATKYDPRAASLDGMDDPATMDAVNLDSLEKPAEKADTAIEDQPNEPTAGNQPDTSGASVQSEQPGKLQPDAGTVRRGNAKSNTGNASRGTIKDAPPDFVPATGGLTREGSWYETAKRNIDLIELAIKVDSENRAATPDEQAKLSKYVGFGASAIRNELFPVPPAYAKSQEPNRLIWPQYVRNDRFKPLAQRIEALPREWQQSILQSSQYAHYTSEGIIRSVWGALERMGFKGGQVFEPGMGIGSFAMLMPNAVRAESRYTGVEFDAPTALIAKLLSPQQNMLHGDFIKGRYPKNFFDVNVGNPPFSQTKIFGDPEYAKKGFMLHDFFFAKGIDLVRPGGIQVFVTSKGTMDKQTDKARKYLSERADLLGAIRLPSTAFEDNAGTSVVTDVIFLRKRLPSEAPAGESWASTATVETKDGPVVVNEYFAKHPEMVLGQQRISGNVDDQGRRINSNGMGGEKYTVVSYDTTPAELEAKFATAIEQLPKGAYSEKKAGSEKAKDARVDFDPSVKREGVVYLAKDGTLMRVAEGVGVPLANTAKLNDKDQAWFKSYVGLRDLVQEARFSQLNEKAWESALAKLNKAYDKFVKEHGHILDYRVMTRKSTDEEGNVVETESRIPKNRRLLREDYDQALVTSLEAIAEDGSIVKSPFLKGRTIGKPVSREVKSIGDALAVSLDDTGHFDLADVGKRLKLDEQETIEALGNQIFQTPDGEWQLTDEYLSGDVVAKLEEAEAAARINPDLRRNVEALKDAQPEKLGPAQISAKLGASWIPESHVNAFAQEISAGQVTFDPRTETWQVDGGNKQSGRMAGAEYGTARRSPSELLESILNSRSIKITQTIDKKTVPDQEATTAANEMAKKIKDKFKGWVWTDTDRATELVESYNKNFNNIAPRRFDGSHLTLPGVSLRYKLHPHQLRAIWRMIQTGNTYLAHAVGAGKTIEMIAGGMEQKRLGLIKKPMYVVPNHMLEQFSNEFMELYPLANIMVADDENFSPERRKAFIASATLNSPDAIVITHDAFQRIGVKEESVAPIRDEILSDLEIELSETAKSNDTRVRRGQLEQQIEAVKQRFDRIVSAGSKDSTIKFEDMGVDFVFADEAHVFRKLDFHTAQQIKGIDPNGSKRALDMYVKTRILEQKKPGRSMVFASGTPVTNTMGELYTIMRFFAGSELDKSGISTFDAWARQFGEVAPALEPNAAGKYELIERFAKFDNVPELMSRVRQFMDVLTSDNLGALVKRPNIIGGKPNLNIIPTNSDLTDYMKGELARRIDVSRAWKPSKDQPHNPDPIVAIITDGRFAAIDPRFFGGTLKEGDKSIITEMGDKVVASYHATKNDVYLDKDKNEEKIKGSTQIVFYNLGFGEQSQKSRGFNSRAAFTKRLTDGGIPRAEIAWFDDANSDAKKEAVFKAMRNGTIKVLIGSAKKMGTGVNVQKRLAVLHYQDPPWFPADVEQPHGRILRQGNQNEEIAIEWYTTKGTYQSTMWQMVGRKQRFIDQAFTGDKTLRSMDDLGEASLFEQAAAVASGDPRAIQLAGLKQDVERFTRLQAAHASEQINVRSALNSANWQIESSQNSIKTLEKAFKAIGEKYFSFTAGRVNGREYSKPGEFGQAIKDEFNRQAADSVMGGDLVSDKQIASIGSAIKVTMDAYIGKENKPDGTFDISVEFGGSSYQLGNAAAMGADVDATGLARRIFNKINEVDNDLQKARRTLAANETDVIKLRKKLGAPFEYQQEMAEKYGELKRLEAELEAEGKATPVAKTGLVIKADGTANGEAPEAFTNLSQTGAQEGNDTDVVFSRQPNAGKPGHLSTAAVKTITKDIAKRWENAPTIIVVQDMNDTAIPERVRKQDAQQRSQGAAGDPEGFFFGNKVYIVANQMTSVSDVARVLFHETLGHFGLRGAFGKNLAPILKQIATLRKADVTAKAAQYGLDMNKPNEVLQAAEEVLAEWAQTKPEMGFVKRAVAAIRQALRALGLNLRLTDEDIIASYLLPARGFVERARRAQGGVMLGASIGPVFDWFNRFGSQPGTPLQGLRDAKSVLNLGASIESISDASIGDFTPAAINTKTGALHFNPNFKLTRAQWAQVMAEELIHSVDLLGPNTTLSAASKRLAIGSGDIAMEAKKAHASKRGISDYLSYPLSTVYGFSPERQQAEIFARLAVLYHGDPKLMQRELPIAYEAYHDLFGTTLLSPESRLLRDIRSAGTTRSGPTGSQNRQGAGVDGGAGPGNQVQRPNSGLESLRARAASIFNADRNGALIDDENLNSVAPNNGAMFSRTDTTQSQDFVVSDLASKFGNRLSDFRGMALQTLGRRQLVDIYAKDLTQLTPYSDMVAQMDADKNESGAEADGVATEWGSLDESTLGSVGKYPGMERKLAELMHDATLAQIDPDKEFVNGDDANQYEALRHGFEQLSPKAKETYRKARDMYVAHNDKVRQAIRERIERSELSPAKRKALLEKMDGEFFKKVKGVYFPLARFGQYVTVVKDSAGNVVSANRSETMNEAEATRKILQSQFPLAGGFKVGKVLKEKEFNASRDGVGRGFMADLFETLDKTNAGEELIDSISQLYLAALPDLSWAKHGIHRKGTPGFSQDARRAFAQNMFHGARYLAKLRYADQLQTHLDDMQEHVAAKSDDEKYPSVAAQNVVDEMVKRHDAMMNPQTNPVSTALTSFGFVFHLGLSPASALVNLSQTALVALPVMGAKWGFTKSSAALLNASKQAAGNKNDISAVLKGDELAAYNEAVLSGVIDVTMAHDLAGIAQGEDSKVAAKIRPVMKWASFLFHHAEKFNRQVTFVAAYRLAKEAGADHSKAYAQAVKATYDGHFDYSASNRARFLQGNWQKVILLFKQYAQNMIYTLTRQAYQAVKAGTPEERSEARKALSGLLVAHAMAAGVFGLPAVGMLLSAASMIGSDDDEPWDAKVALQNMLADTIGQKQAEVVAHGLSRLTPWDISGRVGLDKLLLPDIQEGLSGTPAAQAWLASMAGPVAGIGVNMVKGLADMGEGQYQRGLESMMPTALRGPLKAYRYASEGNIDKTGVAINDEVSAAGVLGQALGLSPSETRLAQEGKSAIYSADKAVQGRRSDLVRHFAMASLAQDAEGVRDARKAIARFNERNASSKITQSQMVASVKARRRRIEQSKQGVYLPSKRQEAMEAGRFAVVE